MQTYLVLTIIADDRPGLVDSLAATIGAHSGNWLESNMSQLAGKFAGILRVSVATDSAAALVAALNALGTSGTGMKLVIEQVDGVKSGNGADAAREALTLELVANDRPGIVSEISRTLAELAVNVESLTSFCEPAPMSGEPLFRARVELSMPAALRCGELRARLEGLADDLMVEIVD
jgi:glycine cleavage system regulatory protein